MALDFIYRFQLKVREVLEEHLVRAHVNYVYVSVTAEKIYPFILLNILKIENISNAALAIYSIEFEICIFSNERNKKTLINVSNLVEPLIVPEKLAIAGYNIAGLKLTELFFSDAKDLLHNKLTMRYKTMLKKEVI